MDKKRTLEMIAAISNANGTSGFEDEVVAAALPYAKEVGETSVDHMLNLYIKRFQNTGKRPVVQLDGHSDEVGFMVQAICPNGTLRIIQLGGWVNHNIPAHKVWVRNKHSPPLHDRGSAQGSSGYEGHHCGRWRHQRQGGC